MPQHNDEVRLRVAAVCYRRTPAGPEFLLVRTWDGAWTFPKGMIDPDKTEIETAETEAWEEAGAKGVIEQEPLTIYSADRRSRTSGPTRVEVTAYLLEVRSTQPPLETHRKPQWFSAGEARRALADGRSGKRAREFERVLDLAVQKITSA